MNKQRLAVSMLPVITILVLEALPYGAVLNFGRPPEEGGGVIRETYSYFSLTPFGYANFFPLLTAVLTVIVLLLAAGFLLKKRKKRSLHKAVFVCSAIAFVCSMMPPIQFRSAYLSVTGVFISILWLFSLILQKVFARSSD